LLAENRRLFYSLRGRPPAISPEAIFSRFEQAWNRARSKDASPGMASSGLAYLGADTKLRLEVAGPGLDTWSCATHGSVRDYQLDNAWKLTATDPIYSQHIHTGG
jgi:hypothetical protein